MDDLAKLYRGVDGVTVADERLQAARRMFMMRLGVLLVRGNGAAVRKFRQHQQLHPYGEGLRGEESNE